MTDHFIAAPNHYVCYFRLVFSTVTHPLVQGSQANENTKPLFFAFFPSFFFNAFYPVTFVHSYSVICLFEVIF